MTELSPRIAAEIAQEVYQVQSEFQVKVFLGRKEFSNSANGNLQLTATVGFRLINTQDGFGVCASGGPGYENDIFIIFRGSTTANYCADWFSNARIGVEYSKTGLPVHVGFNHIFTSMLPQIQSFLAQRRGAIRTIHVVGHSLGGAVATLAADWVKSQTGSNVQLYTFGAPKPGLDRFTLRATNRIGAENIHRVYHSSDPVPMVPVYPFSHAPMPGSGYAIPTEGLVSFSAHSMGKYVASVSKTSWLSLQGPPVLQGQDRQIEQWLASDAPVNPSRPSTWDWINSALVWVLKKSVGGAVSILQSPFVVGFTLADKIAWLLRQGIDLAASVGGWVLRLMGKIMQALGMVVAKTVEELTQAFMRMILQRLMTRISQEARRAIRHLTQR